MVLRDADAQEPERSFDAAFHSFNGAFHDAAKVKSTLTLRTQQRISGCWRDVVVAVPLLRTLNAAVVSDSEARLAEFKPGFPPDEESRRAERFAVTMKATFFFLRALQDAACGALVELDGGKVTPKTSMTRAIGPGKKYRPVFEEQLPGYTDWFYRFRDIRNRMKEGVMAGTGYRGGSNLARVNVMHLTNETVRGVSHPVVQIYCEVTLTDINEALRQSTALFNWIEGRLKKITTDQPKDGSRDEVHDPPSRRAAVTPPPPPPPPRK